VAFEKAFELPPGSPPPATQLGLFRGEIVPFQEVDGDAVLGDVVLGRVADLAVTSGPPQESLQTATSATYRWPNGIVPFAFEPGFPNPGRVTQALVHWNAKLAGTISLIPRTSEIDYILFKAAPGDGICSSYIGRMGIGAQAIRLGALCGTGNVIHEVGHAIGLYHEHSRRDRNAFVKVHLENVLKGFEDYFALEPAGVLDSGQYDFGSIMHYNAIAYSANGQPTLETIPPGIPIGQRVGLSNRDITSVTDLYPSNSFGPPPSNTQQALLGGIPANRYPTLPASGDTTADNLPFVGVADSSGAFYVGGTRTADRSSQSAFLTKFTPSGALVWQREPRPQGSSITASPLGLDGQGNVYVAGVLFGDPSGLPCFIAKYDSSGNLVWLTPYGGTVDEAPQGLFTEPSGVTTLVGRDLEFNGIIIQFNPDGSLQRRLSILPDSLPAAFPRLYSVLVDAGGNIYIGGSTETADFAGKTGDAGPFYAKLTPTGAVLWSSYLGSDSEFGPPTAISNRARGPMALDPDGNLYATGMRTTFVPGGTDRLDHLYLVKIDSGGARKWLTPYNYDLPGQASSSPDTTTTFGLVRDPVTGNLFVSATYGIYLNYSMQVRPNILAFDPAGNPLWSLPYSNGGVLFPSNPVLSQGYLFQFGATDTAFPGMPAPSPTNWALYLSRFTLTGVPR
jgi:hypothetical protein